MGIKSDWRPGFTIQESVRNDTLEYIPDGLIIVLLATIQEQTVDKVYWIMTLVTD